MNLFRFQRKSHGLPSVGPPQRQHPHRGFNIVELLIALSITATLMVATMIALDASYTAYQRTTRAASTHTISRITLDRIQSLIRNGEYFEPRPADPNDAIVASDYIDIWLADDQVVRIEWVEADETLYVRTLDPDDGSVIQSYVLLEGVVAQYDESDQVIAPFTLEYHLGFTLYRATIDMMIVPDDNMSVQIEGTEPYIIRLIGSALPRRVAYDQP